MRARRSIVVKSPDCSAARGVSQLPLIAATEGTAR
jgi:hypothetical protein